MRTLATIVVTAAITLSGAGIAAAEEETEKPPTATIDSGSSPRDVGASAEPAGTIEPAAEPESGAEPIDTAAAPEDADAPRPDPTTVTTDELIEATAPDDEE
ncbi:MULTISPECIES: hypothetical protein [Tsukamurella]|uniref:Uncharacterized protein n=2 Tax=Tsukamurella TaxID=2060 RepID=A0A5C5S1R5_9ACTN|nr:MULTISPECIES: hypothetical protein [Tsukamurella]NMD57216.1 hypothetical protein [Tsukamurella columbiensis]TWS29367.1 hypothetical protein FK530_07440 [Tsukamurella conjunctivitidis]